MDFKIPLVGKGLTFVEIPDEISVYFEIGGCINDCKGCHSPHHREQGELVEIEDLRRYAINQKRLGATAIVLMGGTASKFITKEKVKVIINELSKILPVGLYSGAEVDEFFMAMDNLSWYKAGRFYEALGGLESTRTNQRFYQRNNNNNNKEWELKNEKFTHNKHP